MEALTTKLIWNIIPVAPTNRLCLRRGGFTNFKVLGSIALYSSPTEIEKSTKTTDHDKAVKVSRSTASTQNVEREHGMIPTNTLAGFYSSQYQGKWGKVYDAKPFKMRLYPDKKYFWCACGYSKTQPFCDGSHKTPNFRIDLRPIALMVPEEKDYWLCNCKQSKLRPFCDGTHHKYDLRTKKLKEDLTEEEKEDREKRGKKN